MKKTTTFLIGLVSTFLSVGQSPSGEPALIPQPVSLTMATGTFTLPKNISILVPPQQAEVKNVAAMLGKKLGNVTGYSVITKESVAPAPNSIRLVIDNREEKSLGKEGYRLAVTPAGVTITAVSAAGIFYGTQTMLQLLPPDIESQKMVKRSSWSMPAVQVMDYPRFAWRGLMFDVSRHFFNKAQVKEFIDEMVRYKYNLLHMHLTDDEGWRVEIKALPKLTEVGAWNVKKVGTFGNFTPPTPDEPRNYGGFFTQDDIRELVKYAKERFVNIMPEIDIPGHSMAAVASYPELSCTPGTYTVNSGEKFMEWPASGHFYGLVDNTLCPANDKVYEFLDKVFTEVAQLFPFEYIHMGGDETAKNFWEKSDAIKALMQKEGLKNMDEVQSYFVKRVEKIIESKGKKLIGWDEILEGGLAPNAVVMSWRGIKGGIEAAKQGHEVVMSPTTFAYLDYIQGDPAIEPPVYATLRLNTTYSFEPVPEGVDPKFVKGGQANLWTEQVYNMRHLQYMVWPRGFAIAESVWSPKEKKNWKNFSQRVEKHFERYNAAEIKYAPSIYDPIITAKKDGDGPLKVVMNTEIDGLDIYYSFDNSFPDNFYPKYTGEVEVPKDAAPMKVITYRNGKPIGRMITIPINDLKKRADKN